jgi:hypothetical protein
MWPYIEIPKYRNRKLELTGLANPGKTPGQTGTGPGLARQGAACRIFVPVWNWTETVERSGPEPLAVYMDPLVTLL